MQNDGSTIMTCDSYFGWSLASHWTTVFFPCQQHAIDEQILRQLIWQISNEFGFPMGIPRCYPPTDLWNMWFFAFLFSALPGPAWPNGPTRMAQGQEATQGHQSTTGWAQTCNFLGLFAWWDLVKTSLMHCWSLAIVTILAFVNIQQHKKIDPIHGVSTQV